MDGIPMWLTALPLWGWVVIGFLVLIIAGLLAWIIHTSQEMDQRGIEPTDYGKLEDYRGDLHTSRSPAKPTRLGHAEWESRSKIPVQRYHGDTKK